MAVADLEIVYRDPAELRAYARNARTHSTEQIAQIRRSIREYGFTNPILLKDDETTIGAGHGRHQAATEEGLARVPTIVLRGLTDAQWRAYVIADNKIAENAGWDINMLRAELTALRMDGLTDLTMTGFGDLELTGLFAPPPQDPGPPAPTLMDRFGVAPFSVLRAAEGWWQDRKRQWLALGIQSELGRGENLIGRSIFDRLSVILGVHYNEVRAYVDAGRARGLTDDQIEAEALADPKNRARANQTASFRDQDKLGAIQAQKKGGSKMGGNKLDVGGGGLADPMAGGQGTRREKTQNVVAGKGWAEGGPARRDAAFYDKKRAWEAANGRKISTKDFREQHWDGAK